MVNSTEPSPPAGGAATFATMPELGGDDVEEGAIPDGAIATTTQGAPREEIP